MDLDKLFYLENLLLMLIFALKVFMEKKNTECLIMVKYMVRLPLQVPDYQMSIQVLQLQGMLHAYQWNMQGALKSFSMMRDAAE